MRFYMEKVVLANGLTVIFERKPSTSVVVEVMVKVGSNQELEQERGIAHFIEHMVFEGTKKRPTNREISNEIEKIGGDFNAYTTNERTCFHVKVLKKHFHTAVEVFADILLHPLFKEEHLIKERNIVLKEIDTVDDDPKFYQWILLQKNLFVKHPCRYPTYGERKIIRGLNEKKVWNYFKKYYVPSNMVISIVGDVSNWKKEIITHFTFAKGKVILTPLPSEPITKKLKIVKEKRKINNTYMALGFKTVPRLHPDAAILEVINGILGRGQSGKMFTEIRSKRGLAYDVGTQHIGEVSFGYFAVYATIDRKNVELARKLMLKELRALEHVSAQELKEAKDFIEGDYLLELEESQKMADQILFWEQVKDARRLYQFIPSIKKVSAADVRRVAAKYFKNYTLVVLEGK